MRRFANSHFDVPVTTLLHRRRDNMDEQGLASLRLCSQGHGMRLALYQPDQAGNVGTILRLAACFGIAVDLIEPCGFPFSDRALRRSGMDYAPLVDLSRHSGWGAFEGRAAGRLVLLTTRGSLRLDETQFLPTDILLLGSESRGVPEEIHERAALRVRIPQVAGTRSLNIAVAAGIALGEALRQTGGFPDD